MKWVSEKFSRPSSKNERINVERRLGTWSVLVHGYTQTGSITNAIWKDAFKRVSKINPSIQRILMLGLGAGGGVKYAHDQFPDSTVVAIEFDPEMIALAKRLQLHKPYPFPLVHLGDARTIPAELGGDFDLIIIDVFEGSEPASFVGDFDYYRVLTTKLSAKGIILANVFQHYKYLSIPQELFNNSCIWKYRGNWLGAFWEPKQPHN